MAYETLIAATSWPDAAIAIAGVALVGSVVVVVVWQVLATWRARILATPKHSHAGVAGETDPEVYELIERLDRLERASKGAM